MSENFTTTQSGAPVASDAHSLTTGPDGITALHDRYLVEKLASFNRERVPERNPHAKGGGAFGEFVVTEDVSKYTRAAVFQPGATSETLLRFSSVAGEQGSPDTWRDVRGFALRFYSTEGNYDVVGNNTPVFFIRDGLKFPDFIHSQKRMGASGLRNADMQWDFWTHSPESAHQVTYLMGDRGLPTSWREMNGYGSHTYQWINAEGERFWVQYHFISRQGVHNMGAEEAEKLAGSDADFYRRDLFENIAAGQLPDLGRQGPGHAVRRGQDLPLQPVRHHQDLVARGLPADPGWPLHAEPQPAELLRRDRAGSVLALEHGSGHGHRPDKMLMARVFSYPDAQRNRIGTNYNQLPVNQPHAATVRTYMHEGAMQYHFNDADARVYTPNSFGGPEADAARAGEGSWETDGELVRAAQTLRSEDSDFGQAGTLYREVFTAESKERFHATLLGQCQGISIESIRERFFQYWTNVDANLGAILRESYAAGVEGSTEGAADMAAN